MKKSLVLAMAMALGVTASAYAANPFSDVPAGHWAYDSIDKLAAAGVIDGMGDGTYQGDKTMTRYEMAQIVAKAMAKGANVDKLAAEFADELDNLGVRVANLEKKADNVKINGEIRFRRWAYGGSKSEQNKAVAGKPVKNGSQARTRIWINGQVNEDWTYTGMLENIQEFESAWSGVKGVGEETTSFQRAYVNGKIGGVKVQAGRYDEYLEDGNLYNNRADGVILSYGKKVNVKASYAQITPANGKVKEYNTTDAKVMYAVVSAPITSKIGAHVGYYNFKDVAISDSDLYLDNPNKLSGDAKVWTVGVDAKLAKSLSASALYMKSNKDKIGTENVDDDSIVIGLNYKGVSGSRPGSYGIWAKYYDQAATSYLAHTMDGGAAYFRTSADGGFKGYGIGADYTFAKNIIGSVGYWDLKAKQAPAGESKETDRTLWTTVVFKF